MSQFVHGVGEFVLIVGAFAFVALVSTVVFTMRLQLRLRRMRGMSRDQFIASFANQEVWADVAGCVFDELRAESFSSRFELTPQTDLGKTFDREPEDILEVMSTISKKLGFRPPSEEDLQAIRASVVFTARNLVEHLVGLSQTN